MRLYLDAAPIIYLIEGTPALRQAVMTRLAGTRSKQDIAVASQLTRLECRVKPMGEGDLELLRHYDLFFLADGVEVVGTDTAVWEKATEIRARHRFRVPDAVHLASAVLHGCDRFLTNDHRLDGFPEIPVEVIGP